MQNASTPMAQPLDYLGINYYMREVAQDNPTGPGPKVTHVAVPGATLTAMGWEVYAKGLEEILVRTGPLPASQLLRPPQHPGDRERIRLGRHRSG